MKKIIFIIASLVISTQASAGTALVLYSESGLSMIYPAADYAGDTEPLPYDVAICDGDFEKCLEFTQVSGDSEAETTSYKAGDCEITITRSEQKDKSVETVSISKGADSCKVQNGADLESIGRDFIFDYNR